MARGTAQIHKVVVPGRTVRRLRTIRWGQFASLFRFGQGNCGARDLTSLGFRGLMNVKTSDYFNLRLEGTMPFGVTYAVFVGAILGLMAFGKPSDEMKRRDVGSPNWALTYGQNAPRKSDFGQDGVVTLEYRSDRAMWFDLKPLYAVGTDMKGAFVAVGLRKDFYFGKLQVTPFFGPALYQSDLSDFSAGELIQLRTGIDVALPVSDRVRIAVGYYHLSNARNDDHTAGIDVTRISIVGRF